MIKIIPGMLLSIFASSFACAQNLQSIPSNVEVTRNGLIYSVSANETLSSISQKFTGQVNHWRAIGESNHIGNDRTIPIGKKILIPSRLLTPVSAFAKIKSFFGKVVIQSSEGSNIEAALGTLLKEGDTLMTLADGFISLALEDGTQFTLPPNSTVSLKMLRATYIINSPRTELFLQKGRVKSQVTPFVQPDSRFEVQSPLAVSGVRGTVFRVNYDQQRVLNEVIEGKVAVNSGVQAKATKTGQLVTHGYGTVVENGRVGKPVALLAVPTMSDGYQTQHRLPIQFALSHPSATSFSTVISTDSAGANNIAEAFVKNKDGTANAKFENLEDGEYFVHYSAIDQAGLEGVPGTLRFRVEARPFPPFLLSPAAKFQSNHLGGEVQVPMQWSQTAGAYGYRLQVASDQTFASTVVDQTIEQDVAQTTVPLKIGSYYWRVATIIKNGPANKQGPFGDAKKLELLPELPAPAAKIGEEDVHFTWSATAGQRFTFQISESNTFDKLLNDIETTQSEASIPAPQAGTYYARVRSIDADGFIGTFSPPQKFVIPARWRTEYGGTWQSMDKPVGTGF